MMSSNFEKSLAISRLCEDILSTNEKIQSVCALNKNGRVVESISSTIGITSKMNLSEIEMFYMQRTLQISLGMEFDELISPLNCMIVERETFFEFLFPYSEGVIFVITDLDVVSRYLSKKTLFVLNDFEWRIKNSISEYA